MSPRPSEALPHGFGVRCSAVHPGEGGRCIYGAGHPIEYHSDGSVQWPAHRPDYASLDMARAFGIARSIVVLAKSGTELHSAAVELRDMLGDVSAHRPETARHMCGHCFAGEHSRCEVSEARHPKPCGCGCKVKS